MKNKIAIWLACGYLGLCIPQLAAHEIIGTGTIKRSCIG